MTLLCVKCWRKAPGRWRRRPESAEFAASVLRRDGRPRNLHGGEGDVLNGRDHVEGVREQVPRSRRGAAARGGQQGVGPRSPQPERRARTFSVTSFLCFSNSLIYLCSAY